MEEFKESWNDIKPEKDVQYKIWENEDTGDTVEVREFEEDETWDTFMNEDLIANRDSAEDAIKRAEKLMKDLMS